MDKGEPAFPSPLPQTIKEGLTKREWFAGMALQGLCANSALGQVSGELPMEWMVSTANRIADAMLANSHQEEPTHGQ